MNNNKRTMIGLLLLCLLSSTTAPGFSTAENSEQPALIEEQPVLDDQGYIESIVQDQLPTEDGAASTPIKDEQSGDVTPSENQQVQTGSTEVEKAKKYVNGYTINSRLMVPIRSIAGSLGLRFKFENDRLIVEDSTNIVEFVPGSKRYVLNGIEYIGDTETVLRAGQTYIPFHILAKSFEIPYYYHSDFNWIGTSGEKEELYLYLKPETSLYAYKPKQVTMLMYHHVEDGLQANGVIISPAKFREQLKALKAEGYETITERDYINYRQGKTLLPKKPLIITFDDGYMSNYLEAFPILAEEGFKATIYVTTSKADSKPAYVQYMSWEQMKEMVDSEVIDIQSHSHDAHFQLPKNGRNRGYALVDPLENESINGWKNRIKEDMRLSKQIIEEKLGNEVYAYAYPYGVYNQTVINLLKQEGYMAGVTIIKETNTSSTSLMELRRYTADGRYSGKQLVSIIK